jgi:Leucine-rich repeat (LRR) protein
MITNFKRLTSLILDDSYIPELPESIGLLSSLQKFAVLNGPDFILDGLPRSFSLLATLKDLSLSVHLNGIAPLQHLTGLTKLYLTSCQAESQFPDVIWNLTSLKILSLSGNPDDDIIEEVNLPDDIANLKNLQSLTLIDIKNMYELPQSIGTLSCLTELKLWDIGAEILPDSIGNLKGLKFIDIGRCLNLCELPSSIGGLDSLEELRLRHCPELRKLPDAIGKLDALLVFSIVDCEELTESFADLVLLKDNKNWSPVQVEIAVRYTLLLSPKMEQAMELLRSRGVLVEK